MSVNCYPMSVNCYLMLEYCGFCQSKSTALRRSTNDHQVPAVQERGTLNYQKARIVIEVEDYKAGNPRHLIGWPVWASQVGPWQCTWGEFYRYKSEPFRRAAKLQEPTVKEMECWTHQLIEDARLEFLQVAIFFFF